MQKLFLIKIILLVIFLIDAKDVVCQTTQTDFELLKNDFIQKNSPARSGTEKNTLGSWYRKCIHAQLGTQCFYESNCLDFAKGVFNDFGFIKGSFLSIDRISRCSAIALTDVLPSRLSKNNLILETSHDYRLHK